MRRYIVLFFSFQGLTFTLKTAPCRPNNKTSGSSNHVWMLSFSNFQIRAKTDPEDVVCMTVWHSKILENIEPNYRIFSNIEYKAASAVSR